MKALKEKVCIYWENFNGYGLYIIRNYLYLISEENNIIIATIKMLLLGIFNIIQ